MLFFLTLLWKFLSFYHLINYLEISWVSLSIFQLLVDQVFTIFFLSWFQEEFVPLLSVHFFHLGYIRVQFLQSRRRGLSGNLSDLAVASSQYDILLCSETLVPDLRHVSELLVPGFGRNVLLCRGKLPRARGMAAYVRDGYGAFRQPKFECGCCEMLVVRVFGLRQNFYV